MSNTPQEQKVSAPMDQTVREVGAPQDFTPRPRDCYAVLTLITEVNAMYPDVEVEPFNPNGRGVNISVAIYDHEEPDLIALLPLIGDEPRVEVVERVMSDRPGFTVVHFVNNPVTYDLRAPFGLVDAYKVLSTEDGEPDLIDPDDDLTEEEETERPSKPTRVIYLSKATGRAVTDTYAKRNPDKVEAQTFETSEEDE